MGKVIVHIGANKTASTTLQHFLFARSPELAYVGEGAPEYMSYRNGLISFVLDDDILFPAQEVQALFRNTINNNPDKTFIYSHEDIMNSCHPTACADRLQRFLPEAEIVLIIRNQLTAVPSMYINHGAYLKNVPESHRSKYVSFDSWMEFCLSPLYYTYLEGFFYHRILKLYEERFGKERIHVLLFEDFVKNKAQFITDLCHILDIDVKEANRLLGEHHERRRHTQREYRYHQFRSRFFWKVPLSRFLPAGEWLAKKWASFLEKGDPVEKVMSPEWQAKIAELYKADNRALAEKYQLPLAKYGYPL